MKLTKSTIIVIFGISGDLSKRYILKAIGKLAKENKLPQNFKIIGITRKNNLEINPILEDNPNQKYLSDHIEILNMDTDDSLSFKKLKTAIEETESEWHKKAEVLFYLSVPPQITQRIIKSLGDLNLKKENNLKILLEKPFGSDLANAKKEIKNIKKYFQDKEIYRIDHYLFKKIVPKIISFKEKVVHKKSPSEIESIQIVASETIEVGNRAQFYEQTGALRDMIQSHLLELLSIVLLNISKNSSKMKNDSREARYQALKNIYVDIKKTKIAQYVGYKKEAGNAHTTTETFVSVTLESKDPKWKHIPLTLVTGKAFDKKETFVKIIYKNKKQKNTELIFKEDTNKKHNSYEDVLYSAMNNDKNYFVSEAELLEDWRIVAPVLKQLKKIKEIPLATIISHFCSIW